MSWMAWTTTTAIFFITITMILVGMTLYELRRPCIERKGFLPIATTRGDRLFIGLLSSAFLHLTFLGITDLSIWIVFLLSILWLVVLMRWG